MEMQMRDLVLRFIDDVEYFGEDTNIEVKWSIDNNIVSLEFDGKKFKVTFEEG